MKTLISHIRQSSLSIFVILFLAFAAAAQTRSLQTTGFVLAPAAGWSTPIKIASIEASNVSVGGQNGVWLNFTPALSHSCGVKGNGQYMLGGNPDNVNKMTSIATDAFINSRTVQVYWSGCSGPGNQGYPILLGIWLK